MQDFLFLNSQLLLLYTVIVSRQSTIKLSLLKKKTGSIVALSIYNIRKVHLFWWNRSCSFPFDACLLTIMKCTVWVGRNDPAYTIALNKIATSSWVKWLKNTVVWLFHCCRFIMCSHWETKQTSFLNVEVGERTCWCNKQRWWRWEWGWLCIEPTSLLQLRSPVIGLFCVTVEADGCPLSI